MVPVSWLPEFLSYPLYWIYLNQTLIAGGIAGCAAYFTIRKIQNQISQQYELERERLRRRSRAIRASLPSVLSDISTYTEEAVACVQEVHKRWKDDLAVGNVSIPPYPDKSISKLSDAIEFFPSDDAKKLAGILAWVQIHDARLRKFIVGFRKPGRVLMELNFHQLYFDAICLQKLIDRCYNYGRATEDAVGEISSAEDAIATLNLTFNIYDENLEAKVRRDWPPKFHDYADGLGDW